MSIGRSVAYNSLVSAGARIVNLALSLIIIGFTTRYLGQIGFGHYATILAFLSLFTVLADLGLYSIGVREISRPAAQEKEIISNIFTLRVAAGLFFFALAPLAVLFFPYPSEVKTGMLIGAAGYWFLSNQQVLIGIFQKYLKMDKVALAEFGGRLSQLLLVIFFVQRDSGFLAIVSAMTLGSLATFLATFIFGRRYIKFRLRFDLVAWRSVLRESLPLAVAAVFTVIYFKIDTVMLSLIKGPIDVGIYNLAYKFLESLLFFPAMFVGLVMPFFSRYAFASQKKLKRISQQTLNILLMLVVPMMLGTFFISDRLCVLIAGADFFVSGGVLDILIVAAGIIFLGFLFSYLIIALGKQKILAVIYGLGAAFNFLANLYFIPHYSYYGAALTTVATELLVTALMWRVISRAVAFRWSFACFFKGLAAALPMLLLLFCLQSAPLALLLAVASAGYFFFLWLLGGFSIKAVATLLKHNEE